MEKDEATKEFSIMWVDDDLDFSRSISSVFEKEGLTVYHAKSGKQAIDRFREKAPEVIIMDMHFATRSGDLTRGIEIANRIKSINKEIPIIAISSFVDAYRSKALESKLEFKTWV